jgi:hypothetical protein
MKLSQNRSVIDKLVGEGGLLQMDFSSYLTSQAIVTMRFLIQAKIVDPLPLTHQEFDWKWI